MTLCFTLATRPRDDDASGHTDEGGVQRVERGENRDACAPLLDEDKLQQDQNEEERRARNGGARKADDREGETFATYQLSVLAQLEGAFDEALALSHRVITQAEAAGDLSSLAYGNFSCGGALRDAGQYAEAQPYYEPCLEVAGDIDDLYLLAYGSNHLAGVYAALGDRRRARQLYERCRRLGEIGEMRVVGYTLADWGDRKACGAVRKPRAIRWSGCCRGCQRRS